jgi:hypothetical protein
MSMEAISETIRLLCDGPQSQDSELIDRLVEEGLERDYATRLVLFVPVVYARLILGGLKVRFSDSFRRSYGNGRQSSNKELDSDPVWVEAQSYAKNNIRQLSSEERLKVAGRSPEFSVISQALNAGLDPANQQLSPLVVWWPDR